MLILFYLAISLVAGVAADASELERGNTFTSLNLKFETKETTVVNEMNDKPMINKTPSIHSDGLSTVRSLYSHALQFLFPSSPEQSIPSSSAPTQKRALNHESSITSSSTYSKAKDGYWSTSSIVQTDTSAMEWWKSHYLTCTVTEGGTNAACPTANVNLASCTAANIANTCTVTDSGTNDDCAAAVLNSASCTAATTSGGGDDAANACIFVDNSIHNCIYLDSSIAASVTTVPATCSVKEGGTNTACTTSNADLATCTTANILNTCTVTDGGTNADCITANTDLASCTAATTSGGSGDAANACIFVDNSIHNCVFVESTTESTTTTDEPVFKSWYCGINQHVYQHQCVACPPGTTPPVNTDTAGPDSSCTPTLCLENERVFNNICVPCHTDRKNLANDDASQSQNTLCDPDWWCQLPSSTLTNTDSVQNILPPNGYIGAPVGDFTMEAFAVDGKYILFFLFFFFFSLRTQKN